MGTSVKQLIHFAQLIKDKSFQQYDFGTPQKNWEVYHQETPPVINLENIQKVDVAMFAGKQDALANPIDTRNVRDSIKTVKKYMEIDNFDHGSFLLGKDMSYLEEVVALMNQYNRKYFRNI